MCRLLACAPASDVTLKGRIGQDQRHSVLRSADSAASERCAGLLRPGLSWVMAKVLQALLRGEARAEASGFGGRAEFVWISYEVDARNLFVA